MWRIPGERIRLDLDGPTVEVERISSWALQFEFTQLALAWANASKPGAEYAALVPIFERFLLEAQPTWDIADHRGPIPVTVRGMARLPLSISLGMFNQWLGSLPVAQEEDQPESAVDAVIPPGPVNLEIKRRLKKAKAA